MFALVADVDTETADAESMITLGERMETLPFLVALMPAQFGRLDAGGHLERVGEWLTLAHPERLAVDPGGVADGDLAGDARDRKLRGRKPGARDGVGRAVARDLGVDVASRGGRDEQVAARESGGHREQGPRLESFGRERRPEIDRGARCRRPATAREGSRPPDRRRPREERHRHGRLQESVHGHTVPFVMGYVSQQDESRNRPVSSVCCRASPYDRHAPNPASSGGRNVASALWNGRVWKSSTRASRRPIAITSQDSS